MDVNSIIMICEITDLQFISQRLIFRFFLPSTTDWLL